MRSSNSNLVAVIIHLFICHVCITLRLCNALTPVRVIASAPVNPVESNGILSLHCQVWKAVAEGHEVTIFRTLKTGETQRLSVNDNILSDVDERIYLGVRKSTDGSAIYFLSIIGVTRRDIGEYICKVFRVSGAAVVEIAGDSINITSTYLPPDPKCQASTGEPQLKVIAGSLLKLNCSSEIGYPPVTMEWTRTGTTTPLNSRQFIREKVIYKEVSLRLTLQDDNAIFICLTTSRAYPNTAQSCHVGPIQVLPNKDQMNTQVTTISDFTQVKDISPSATEVNVLISGHDNEVRQKCLKTCSTSKNSFIFYWIIATVGASALALLFLILGIYLLVRYLSLTEEDGRRQPSEKIYTELEAEQMLYMSLQKQVRHHKESGYGK